MNKNDNKNSAISKTENIANENENISALYDAEVNERELKAERKRLDKLNALKLKQEKKIAKSKLIKERKRLKQEEKENKALLKREKAEELRREKLQKQTNRAVNGKNKGYGGWLAAVISLGVATLILGGLLTYVVFSPVDDYMNYSAQEERNFYDLVGYVDGIDNNLSKVIVSNDDTFKQELLQEVRLQSNMASESLSNLSIHDEEKYYTVKFINQVGDYSHYLSKKLNNGEKLTQKDYEVLTNMYEINKNLKNELNGLTSNIDENFNFSSIYEDKKDNLIISKFTDLESVASEYPHMIYDGAFSDGTENDKALALKGLKEIKKIEAEEIFKKVFASYGVKNVELTGETNDKVIKTYNFDADLQDGTVISATISKVGGKVINFNNFREAEEVKYTENDCLTIAEKFIKSLGIEGMKAVWTTEGASIDTFNFAYVKNGVVCYPDLIKVNVCRERGIVCSMEAKSYYLNHVNRDIEKATISEAQAKENVSNKIEIETSRLAVIPKNDAEILAYEFTGKYNDETYYVYISAKTGKEIDIFKVVKTTEGNLIV